MRGISRLTAAALAILATLGAAPVRAAPIDDQLAALNALARAEYAKAKADTLAHLGPVIVVEPDALVLIRHGQPHREAYVPDRYRQLKAIAHTAMGLYSLALPHVDQADMDSPDGGAWRGDLERYRAGLAALQPRIGDIGLHWDDAKRQRELVATSIAFLDRIAARGRVSGAELRAYADDVGPTLSGDLYDAALAELTSLDATVKRWKAELEPAEWLHLTVVVLGLGRPHERHPPYDYFARLLGPEAIDTRLIHADNVTDLAGGLDLLATTVTDRAIGAAFFADPHRLDQGLMRDATKRHLDKMFKE